MTKHLIRCVLSVLILILFFIVPASAELTDFDASVHGHTIVVTGTTSEPDETVDIIATLFTDVNVNKHDKYEYDLENVPIPDVNDVNDYEKLTISASKVSDMIISLEVKKLHIWDTTITAVDEVASYTPTLTAEECIDFILDEAGIGGTALGKPAKFFMSYAVKYSPVKLDIKITGTSTADVVTIEQAVHRTTISEDGYFFITYDSRGLPAGTYEISADGWSDTVELKSEKGTYKNGIGERLKGLWW